MSSERIVIGVDFSEASIACAHWLAAHFAHGSELVLAHVLDVPEPPAFLRPLYATPDRLIETARAGAEQQLREITRSVATGLVWTEVRAGKPEEEIARVVAEYGASLVAVGAHGRREGRERALGTTAHRVLRRSAVPVLVAKGAMADAPRRLLVAIDDSPVSAAVLRWTRALAERFGASVVATHVVNPGLMFPPDLIAAGGIGQATPAFEATRQAIQRATEEWLARRLEEAGVRDRTTLAVGVGSPSESVLDEARKSGVDLVIVGSGRPGLVRRTVLGSVAETVIRDADRPVLVITEERQSS